MKKTLVSLSLALFAVALTAQEPLAPCGTPPGKTERLLHYQANREDYPKTNQMLYLPLQIHNVANGLGFGALQTEDVFTAFCKLNQDFAATNIQLYLADDINLIANFDYFDHDYSTGAQMMFENNVPGAINCYIVKNPAGACGYYYGWPDAVALGKNCMGPEDKTWAHEIGHFLSLPHPFSGWEGVDYDAENTTPPFVNGNAVEKVDGSNCFQAGDGFCDTSPDYLSFRWSCNEDAQSYTQQLDPDGQPFQSDGTLLMSYSNDACANRFSEEQTMAMRVDAEFLRPDLPVTATPIPPVTAEDITILQPLEGDHIATVDEATFSWEPVENATHYLVQFSLTSNFIYVIHEYFVAGTSFNTDELRSNRDYYWRILPYNPFNTCHGFFPQQSFTTGDLTTGIRSLTAVENLSISPNPLSAATPLRLDFTAAERFAFQLQLHHATGARVLTQQGRAVVGANQVWLETGNLSPGVYLLVMESEQGRLVRKITVQ